jgi:creatinine amidohydrolase
MTRLAGARWQQVEADPGPVLVVPLGSLEQHGPHLPLATDGIVAAAVCDRLHELRPDAALAPLLPLGASGEHAGFPGTVSVGTRALALMLVELVRDASSTWPAVLVVNGHGGNARALAEAATTSHGEGRRLVAHHLALPGSDAHAGRTETSLLLHLAVEQVDVARAEPGVTTPVRELMARLQAEGVRGVSPNGVLGDPTGASAEEGRELFDRLVDDAVRVYDDVACARSLGSRITGASAPGRPPTTALTSTPLP